MEVDETNMTHNATKDQCPGQGGNNELGASCRGSFGPRGSWDVCMYIHTYLYSYIHTHTEEDLHVILIHSSTCPRSKTNNRLYGTFQRS